jgi:hypothetical protein
MIRGGLQRPVAGAAALGLLVGAAITLSASASASPHPQLTEQQILRVALRAAAGAGDPRPTLIQHAEGSRSAANFLASRDLIPSSAWSYLIAERGRFIAYGASPPLGAPLPRGSVMTIVVDAATGRVTDFGISNYYPPLARLGAVTTDFRSYPSCPADGRRRFRSTTAGFGSQLVPGAPAEVLLCRYSGLNPTPSAVGRLLAQRLVVNLRTVERLSHEFDSLKPFQRGAYSCPADFGVKILAIFRYSGGRSDDPVTLDPAGCASVTNGILVRTAASAPGPTLIGQLVRLTDMVVLVVSVR